MSFGTSVSDIIQVGTLVKDTISACRSGPREYQEICSEQKALLVVLKQIENAARDENSLLNTKGQRRNQELLDIVASCKRTVQELQKLIEENSSLSASDTTSNNRAKRIWHSYRVGSADLELVTSRLNFYVTVLNAFINSLSGSAIARMERKIDELYQAMMSAGDRAPDQDSSSVISRAETIRSLLDSDEDNVWSIMKDALTDECIPTVMLLDHKEYLIRYLRARLDGEADQHGIELVSQDTGLEGQVERYREPTGTIIAGEMFNTEVQNNEWKTISRDISFGLGLYRKVLWRREYA